MNSPLERRKGRLRGLRSGRSAGASAGPRADTHLNIRGSLPIVDDDGPPVSILSGGLRVSSPSEGPRVSRSIRAMLLLAAVFALHALPAEAQTRRRGRPAPVPVRQDT